MSFVCEKARCLTWEQSVRWLGRSQHRGKLTFYRLPRQHHKNLKSTSMLERLMEEIKSLTLVVRPSRMGPLACGRFELLLPKYAGQRPVPVYPKDDRFAGNQR